MWKYRGWEVRQDGPGFRVRKEGARLWSGKAYDSLDLCKLAIDQKIGSQK